MRKITNLWQRDGIRLSYNEIIIYEQMTTFTVCGADSMTPKDRHKK